MTSRQFEKYNSEYYNRYVSDDDDVESSKNDITSIEESRLMSGANKKNYDELKRHQITIKKIMQKRIADMNNNHCFSRKELRNRVRCHFCNEHRKIIMSLCTENFGYFEEDCMLRFCLNELDLSTYSVQRPFENMIRNHYAQNRGTIPFWLSKIMNSEDLLNVMIYQSFWNKCKVKLFIRNLARIYNSNASTENDTPPIKKQSSHDALTNIVPSKTLNRSIVWNWFLNSPIAKQTIEFYKMNHIENFKKSLIIKHFFMKHLTKMFNEKCLLKCLMSGGHKVTKGFINLMILDACRLVFAIMNEICNDDDAKQLRTIRTKHIRKSNIMHFNILKFMNHCTDNPSMVHDAMKNTPTKEMFRLKDIQSVCKIIVEELWKKKKNDISRLTPRLSGNFCHGMAVHMKVHLMKMMCFLDMMCSSVQCRTVFDKNAYIAAVERLHIHGSIEIGATRKLTNDHEIFKSA
jgi:hypothetical protein